MTAIVDPRVIDSGGSAGIDRYFLSESPLIATGSLKVYQRRGIFEKGLRIEGIKAESSFGYNFTFPVTTTRERNDFDIKKACKEIDARIDSLMLEPSFARQAVLQYVRCSSHNQLENVIGRSHKKTEANKAATFLAFEELFGRQAVLSARSALEHAQSERLEVINRPGIFRFWNNNRIEGEENRIKIIMDLNETITKYANAFACETHLQERVNLIDTNNFCDLINVGAMSSVMFSQLFNQKPVHVEPHVAAAALNVIKEADQHALKRLNALKEIGILNNIIYLTEKAITDFSEEVKNRSLSDIIWCDATWPSDGQYRKEQLAPYSYNVKLFSNPATLFEVHLHELAHRLSGLNDYSAEFQLLLALLGPKEFVQLSTPNLSY